MIIDPEAVSLMEEVISDAIEAHIEWAYDRNDGNIKSDAMAHTVIQALMTDDSMNFSLNTAHKESGTKQWH